ncbi:MAG: hypothetical protein ACM3UZ_02700 [Acidobacteriota bacterium]
MPNMNLREGILDALVEERDNVSKVERFLDFMRFEHTRESLIDALTDLLMQGTIEIIHPSNVDIMVQSPLDEKMLNEIKLELTEKGRMEWEAILA